MPEALAVAPRHKLQFSRCYASGQHPLPWLVRPVTARETLFNTVPSVEAERAGNISKPWGKARDDVPPVRHAHLCDWSSSAGNQHLKRSVNNALGCCSGGGTRRCLSLSGWLGSCRYDHVRSSPTLDSRQK